ncbi:MAG: BlaI/MecI/CopY family transcriptional regulator [Planctomycetaceae bacterium]
MKSRRREERLAAGELEILEILWRTGGATIAETHAALPRAVGYTTVQTRLNRLVEKELVRRVGLHPAKYEPVIQPADVSRGDLDVLVRRVTGGQVVPLVAHLVKDRRLTAEEIRELKQLIDEAEKAQRTVKRKGGEP